MQAVNRMLCKDHKGRCLEQLSDVLIPALAASWNDHFGVGLRISASGENPAEAAGPLWQTSSIKQMARAGQGGDLPPPQKAAQSCHARGIIGHGVHGAQSGFG